MHKSVLVLAALAAVVAVPAQAQEAYGGVYAHAVNTPFTFDTGEGGVDLQIGVRSKPIEGLKFLGKPAAHVFGSVNLDGDTNFVAVGLDWKIGKGPIYLRPGIGLAIHDAPSYRVDYATGMRTDLGSRVLFEPEIAIGTRLSDRVSLEASWVHISNARLFNYYQNPGIDMMGLRANVKL